MTKFALYGLLTSFFKNDHRRRCLNLHANHRPGPGFVLGMFRSVPSSAKAHVEWETEEIRNRIRSRRQSTSYCRRCGRQKLAHKTALVGWKC